jgi:hypothetical protein
MSAYPRPTFAVYWTQPVFDNPACECSSRSWAETAEKAIAYITSRIPEATNVRAEPWDPKRHELPGGAWEGK